MFVKNCSHFFFFSFAALFLPNPKPNVSPLSFLKCCLDHTPSILRFIFFSVRLPPRPVESSVIYDSALCIIIQIIITTLKRCVQCKQYVFTACAAHYFSSPSCRVYYFVFLLVDLFLLLLDATTRPGRLLHDCDAAGVKTNKQKHGDKKKERRFFPF